MAITWRDDHEVDLAQLAALFVTAGWPRHLEDAARLGRMIDGARFVVHAWDGQRLVGFARAISDGVTNAYVSTVAVLPEYRRRGIGRELMRRLLAGRDDLSFSLHAGRPEVRAFYEQCGFELCTEMMCRPRRQ